MLDLEEGTRFFKQNGDRGEEMVMRFVERRLEGLGECLDKGMVFKQVVRIEEEEEEEKEKKDEVVGRKEGKEEGEENGSLYVPYILISFQ